MPPPQPAKKKSLDESLAQIFGGLNRVQRMGLVTAGIILLTLLLGYSNIYGPWQNRRETLRRQHGEEQSRSDRLVDIQRQAEALGKEEGEALFTGGTPALTSEVSRIASTIGVEIESVAPRPAAAFGPYLRSQIEVEATSTFSQLLTFLSALEEYRPRLMVDVMDIESVIDPQTEVLQGRASLLQNRSRRRPGGEPEGQEMSLEERILEAVQDSRRRTRMQISVFSKREPAN
ncbi:MAG: hypothetical protein COV76_05630 [Candidatus Omnitrophica bacterium CG11_big_fil_rev_8_21_14_0_20_64_10]|nr:MAG: hypothetical protein COV76_05630 [Candidatus Omnitrophica bacterium CG11_big_fil_rev_8_21_14_0_20_64_10]